MSISRRTLLGFAASALAGPGIAAAPSRLAVIDWALLETCLAMGVVPAAASELRQYRQIVREPAAPSTVADLGLRGTTNFEMLRLVAPELIVISQFYEYQRPMLERVAPVLSLPSYEAGRPPYALLADSTRRLGEVLGIRDAADDLIAEAGRDLANARRLVSGHAARPVFVISLGDSRHFRAFGADSMFGDVLARLDLRNAWIDPTSYSAAAPVGIEALARVPDAGIVVIEPLPPEVGRELPRNALWNALPAARDGRVAILPPINHFGGLPSARRFAGLISAALQNWPAA
ncbi:ABC transporter substrate-binding protein [Mesorhizobium sp. CAU 1741]|uniref:ABC transporter substrate-binding protein n=1 Tax=Mesorhizobium sp. CAU 1741 TaxID=3140366 RepID=UPI00325BE088